MLIGRIRARDRLMFMDEGRIVEQGRPEDGFGNPREPRTQEFFAKIMGH